MDFQDFIANLEDLGVYEVLLPFLLAFVVIFAVLEKVQLFGADTRRFNAIIAFVIAFFFVRSESLVSIVQQFLPKVSMFIIIVLMVLLIIGFFLGKEFTGFGGGMAIFFTILALVVVLWLYAESTGAGGSLEWIRDNITDKDIVWIIILAVAGAIILFALGGKPKSEKLRRAGEEIRRGYGGP